jgi:hypothetical protein
MRLQASTCFLVLLRARVTLLPQGGPLSSRLVPAGLDYIDGLQIGPPNVRFGSRLCENPVDAMILWQNRRG